MTIKEIIKIFEKNGGESVEWLRHELSGLRTSRITTGLIEKIAVEHYGARTPLSGLASISNTDARTLLVAPWDKSAISAIEKALTDAQLGAMPSVEGEAIRLAFPMLNEEMRDKTIKIMHAKAEETRVRLRRARDEGVDAIKKAKSSGDLTEDDFYDGKKDIDASIENYNKQIAEIIESKETEIKTI